MHAPVIARWRPFWSALVQKGGPEPDQYAELETWFNELAGAVRSRAIDFIEVVHLLDSAGDAMSSPQTMQGFVRIRPHGYPGDFEVIDRIYQEWHSPNPDLVKWDRFFHSRAAPRAVRNRKKYFLAWLSEQEARLSNHPRLRLLNVGSGPGRDLQEYFVNTPNSRILCTSIDNDARAIAHAATVCKSVSKRVSFRQENALRFRPSESPHLIWSAGLFDYLNDRLFVTLLRRMWRMLAAGGEMVIGNFSPMNSTRGYMEMGGWVLHHRDRAQLETLALKAGVPWEGINISSEAEGINLFSHLRKSESPRTP